MKPDELKSTLDKMHKYSDDGNLEGYYSYVSDDFVFHRVPLPDVVGKQANWEADEAMGKSFTDAKSTIHETIVEGDVAVVRYTYEALHSGSTPSLGIPATGKRISMEGCMVYHWKDDKLIESWDYTDMLGLLKQIGAFPS